MNIIGIIGFGNMGKAIAENLGADYQVYCFDKDQEKIGRISGARPVSGSRELVNKADVVILAVKPQDFDALLEEIKPAVKDQLIISIAAGLTLEHIEKALGTARVVRAMPNMPAKIGQGFTCLSRGKFATQQDFDFAESLFVYLGETLALEERLMNAATAISGSGPGYCYDLIESKKIDASDIKAVKRFVKDEFIPLLKNAAKAIGFTEEQAALLSAGAGNGSIALLEKSGIPAAKLRDQVTSKGGTTEAALEVLHNGGSLDEAVKAALRRAEELSGR